MTPAIMMMTTTQAHPPAPARPSWRLVAVLAGVLVVTSLAAPARAVTQEETTAAELFRAGTTAFARAEYRAAALSFEEANRHAPHAASIFNAGLAWEAAGEKARAADAYAEALRRSEIAAAQSREARTRLAALERVAVALVRITGAATTTISVAHVAHRPLPVNVHLAVGVHEIVAEDPDGRRRTAAVTVTAGVPVDVVFEARAAAVVQGSATGTTRADSPGPDIRRRLGWTAVSAGVVAAGAAAILGVMALSARDDFRKSDQTSQDAHDRAISLRNGANIAGASSAVLGIAGAVLLLTGRRETGLSVQAGTRNVAAHYAWRF